MGLFSSEIKTTVASVVYNLAGDEDLRPDFLKSTIVGATLSNSEQSIGEILSHSLLNGPGQKQRSLYRWAKTNYALGLPTAVIDAAVSVDTAVVTAGLTSALTLAAGQSLKVYSAIVDDADVDYWAEDWIRLNLSVDVVEDQWSADYDHTADEITIDVADVGQYAVPAPADLIWGMDRDGHKVLFVLYAILTETKNGVTESSPILYTYRMGAGNVSFDTLQSAATPMAEFFPVMPLRINNLSIRDDSLEDEYEAVKKAFRKLTSKNVDTILDELEDQEEIGQVDFAFLVQGVSANSKENEARGYLYQFFEGLIAGQTYTLDDFHTFRTEYVTARNQSVVDWNSWQRGNDLHDEDPDNQALYHPTSYTEPPTVPLLAWTAPTVQELQVHSPDIPNFDFRIRWVAIGETQHVGNGKTFDGDTSRGMMTKGDFWFHVLPDIKLIDIVAMEGRGEGDYHTTTRTYNRVYMFHQHSLYQYSRLEIIGAEHRNYVYIGHAVSIPLSTAIEDDEESGFLLPLHYPSLRSLGLMKGTQLSSSTSHLVLNMYDQQKVKWYQKSIFKVILAIATVILTVVFPPAGTAAGGILGTNIAVGAFLGASAATAAIVGGIANALAAMIVTSLIQQFSTKIFGDKLGAIIGSIIAFVSLTYAGNFAATGTFNVDWGSMMRIENLTKITNSVSNAYSQWLNADTMEIYASIDGLEAQYQEQFDEIQDLSKEILGMTAPVIDPIMFTDAAEYFGESSESFLTRTLLTGSDLAELSQALITNFADISLELPRPVR